MLRASNGGAGPRLVPGLELRRGQVVAGKYRIEDLLGSQASGVVVRALHLPLRRTVALKIMAAYTSEQTEAVSRRVARARVASHFRGDNVARILDIGVTDDGSAYIASEYLEGMSLKAELAARGSLAVEEAVRWILQACEGLAEAHASGVVHGDLKPENLFLANVDGRRVLKILDFGMTSALDGMSDAHTTTLFGSPAYLSPEQIQAPERADTRADFWALGAILFELITGKPPFAADTLSGVLVAVAYDAAPLLTEAPYELARVVSECLAKDPAERIQNVGELAEQLAPFAGEDGARLSEQVVVAAAEGSVPALAITIASPSRDDVRVATPVVRSRPTDTTQRSRRVDLRAQRLARRIATGSGVLLVVLAAAAGWMIGAPKTTAHQTGVTPGTAQLAVEERPVITREALPVRPVVPPSMNVAASVDVRALASAPAPRPMTSSPPRAGLVRVFPTDKAPVHRLPAGLPATRDPVVLPSRTGPSGFAIAPKPEPRDRH